MTGLGVLAGWLVIGMLLCPRAVPFLLTDDDDDTRTLEDCTDFELGATAAVVVVFWPIGAACWLAWRAAVAAGRSLR